MSIVICWSDVCWNRFYRLIVKLDTSSRKELESYVGMSEAERNKELDSDAPSPKFDDAHINSSPPQSPRSSADSDSTEFVKSETISSLPKFNINLKRSLREFKMDLELWNFLREHSEAIL